RRGVAVGNKSAGQPRRSSFLENGHPPFGRDQRLVVARHNQFGVFAKCQSDEFGWRNRLNRDRRGGIAQGLAGDPILAVRTMQVAPHHAERERIAPRVDMEERLLLNRVALQGADVAERHTKVTVLDEPDLADSSLPLADQTAMAASHTADAAILRMAQ